ncbi:hypothetical protein [Maricaulis salignorans]|uniref:Uncharacterized protein n=1 Tax=Maricaulis salignorans TaxID=144026 RepID=A0A1G9W1Z0_9PROT|nr:hypothetical protein [Maricaulis salignorans]SDM78562.1 hypothetical protein SAMN04488568_1229 [Maricaulis salignorans]
MIEDALGWLLLTGFIAFVLASTLAPLETLFWWSRQGRREPAPAPAPVTAKPAVRAATEFIVYLGGIDRISGTSNSSRERRFLAALREGVPDAVMVDSVFPYAASGNPLLHGPRIFSRLWRALDAAPAHQRRPLLANLVNARNFFQVLVSADRRYGPVFNLALAGLIEDSLRAAGWQPGGGARLTLIGLSGGAQMAAGAADDLAGVFDGPIQLISIGGVIASTPGLNRLARIDHLVGSADRVEAAGVLAFPARWPLSRGSEWALARSSGRLKRIPLANVTHNGPRGYFGGAHHGGRPQWEETVAIVMDCIERFENACAAEPAGSPGGFSRPDGSVRSSHGDRRDGSDGRG